MLIHMGVCGIGMGHASRSLAIARELMARGHEVTLTAYGDALEYLRRAGLEPNPNYSVSYQVSGEGAVSFKLSLTKNILLPLRFSAQVARELAYIEEADPDVVYSDTRASTVLAAIIAEKPVVLMLNEYNIPLEVSKFKRLATYVEAMMQAPSKLWNNVDVIIIPDLPPPYTISLRTLNLPNTIMNKVRYVGPLTEFNDASSNGCEDVRKVYGVDEDETLVFLHISGPESERERLVGLLLDIVPRIRGPYRFVMSRGRAGGNGFAEYGKLMVFDWIENVEPLLRSSDIVVARGGLTIISKCILYGRKMLLIPIPRHGEQRGNATRVAELGLGLMIEESELNVMSMQDALDRLRSSDYYDKRLLDIGKLITRLGGVKEVVSIIEKLGTRSGFSI